VKGRSNWNFSGISHKVTSRAVTNRGFFTLSAMLIFEISIAYGILFSLAAEAPSLTPLPDPDPSPTESLPPAPEPSNSPSPSPIALPSVELTPQGQLINPPETIKAVYLTSWSGGSQSRIDYVIDLARTTGLNAVVIDIKDFSGEVAYETDVSEVKKYGAERLKIRNIEALIKRLHEANIYVVARVTVFQDPILARARPDLAVQSIAQEGIWADHKGLGWVDPASEEVWNYTVAIAQDAASRGFDEINFDYVRFPSDGNLQDMQFPVWDEQTLKRAVIREFFAYLREQMDDVVISVDLFGLTTSSNGDLGIGQVIEDAYEYFDYVYPMVYPSHYAIGYHGFRKPAEYPYEVVYSSMASAQARLDALKLANPGREFAKLRPWLQDFDLGAMYDLLMVQSQVQATKDALLEKYIGFLLWAPTNWYTAEALNPFVFDAAAYQNRPRTAP